MPGSGTPTWGGAVVPAWLLNLQKQLPEELRDPELDKMAKPQAGAAQPSPREKASAGKTVNEKAVPSKPEAAPEGPEEGDNWLNVLLSSMKTETGVAAAAPTPPEPTPAADLQASAGAQGQEVDWLSSFRSSIDLPSAAEEGAEGQEDLPDWLQTAGSAAVSPAAPEAPATGVVLPPSTAAEPQPPPFASALVPDWLRESSLPEPPEGATTEAVPMPDWLAASEAGIASDETPPAFDAHLPAWLAAGAAASAVGARGESQPPEAGEATIRLESVGPQEAPTQPEETAGDEVPGAPKRGAAPLAAGLVLGASLAGEGPAEAPLAAGEITQPAAPGLSAPAAGMAAAGAEEMPQWLRDIMSEAPDKDLAGISDEAAIASLALDKESTISAPLISTGEIPGEGADTPTWLKAVRDQQPGEDMDAPTWLSGAESAAEGAQEELPRVQEDTPHWLAGVAAASAIGATTGMPEWMSGLDESQETGQQPSGPGEAVEVPDWLKQMGAYEVASGALSGVGIPPETSAAGAQGPDAIPLGPEGRVPAAATAAAIAASGATVPMSAQEPGVPGGAGGPPRREPATVPMTTGHVLAGIGGVLAAEAALSTLKGREWVVPQSVPDVTDQARVFQEIVSQPLLTTVSTKGKRRNRFWPWLGRLVIYLLVIAAVVVPLYFQLTGNAGFFNEDNLPVSGSTEALFGKINCLPAQSTVLVVFDYDPSLAEELNMLARTLLQHLMLRKAEILLVSTSLTGSQIAQNLMDQLAIQPQYAYRYGEDYLNLGYLPGQESSLLLFARDPLAAVKVDFRNRRPIKDQPIAAPLRSVPATGLGQAVPLIISLSGSQEGLRGWLEQVGAQARDASIVAGVAAGIEPYAQPYLRSGQLSGLVSGLPGAAEYETLLRIPGMAVRGYDSLAAVGLLIVGLIVLGNLVQGAKRLFRRR